MTTPPDWHPRLLLPWKQGTKGEHCSYWSDDAWQTESSTCTGSIDRPSWPRLRDWPSVWLVPAEPTLPSPPDPKTTTPEWRRFRWRSLPRRWWWPSATSVGMDKPSLPAEWREFVSSPNVNGDPLIVLVGTLSASGAKWLGFWSKQWHQANWRNTPPDTGNREWWCPCVTECINQACVKEVTDNTVHI